MSADDLSPPSPQSPEHGYNDAEDQPRRGTPTRHTATGAYKATSPASGPANAKERNLMSLLSKAADEIRIERRKVKQLMEENDRLQQEVKALKTRNVQVSRQQATAAASREMAELKAKYSDLMTVHKALAVELDETKKQLKHSQSRCREQQIALQGANPAAAGAAPLSRSNSPASYAARHGGRSGPSAARATSATTRSPQRTRSAPRPTAAARASSAPRQNAPPVPTSNDAMRFDARASSGLSRSPPRKARAEAVADRSQHSIHADPQRGGQRYVHGGAVAVDPVEREAIIAHEERRFNDVMLSRLRRAIAPPPTKEQMSEVVHAMVTELVKSAARNGLKLELKRVKPCVYECGRRKLHLTVDSRRLVVKCGGGHVDMNEFVQRNRLWNAIES